MQIFVGQGVTKILGYVTQILLLYLIDDTEFGIVTLASTSTFFILLIAQSGITDLLVQRRSFDRWAVPSFWLALVFGLLSCALIALSAPIVAKVYGTDAEFQDQLYWLILASVPSPLPLSLSAVPRAQLSRQLRFRALAIVNVLEVLLLNLLTLLLAWLGFGVYSLVLPASIGGLILSVLLWWWVRPPWSLNPHFRHWRFLIGDSWQLLMSEFGRLLIEQSDYILLGLFHVAVDLVGIYRIGFQFALQAVRLLMGNMTAILFPTFTKLNSEPKKQFQAFLKAQRVLALVGASSCLFQAATAEAIAHLFFPSEWYRSILIIQILSLGLLTRMVGGAAYALMKSHGRFKIIRNLFWAYALLQIGALTLVLFLGGNIASVAIVVSLISLLPGPWNFYFAVRPLGGGWTEVGQVLTRPILVGFLSVGPAWLLAEGLKTIGWGYWTQLIQICVVSVLLNLLLARLLMRPVWDDFWARVWQLIPRRGPVQS